MNQEILRYVEHVRTPMDKFIATANGIRFCLTEPLQLRLVRLQRNHLYHDPSNQNPLVTVIIPTYNRAKLITERSLPAVLMQSYKNLEILIVGDDRIDNTRDLVARLGDPRLRFINVPEYTRYPKETKSRWFVGGVPQRNEGLKQAKGLWIAENDDDAIWTSDHVESLLRFAQIGDYEFASGSYIAVRHNKEVLVDVTDLKPRIGGFETWFYRSYLKLFHMNINSWRKAWNKPQDMDKQERMIKAGVQFGFLDKVVSRILPLPGKETVGMDALDQSRYVHDPK